MTEATGRELLAHQLRMVAEHAQATLAPADAVGSLRRTCRLARVAFRAQSCSVAVVDPSGTFLDYVAADGGVVEAVEGLRMAINQGIAGYVVQSGQIMLLDDVERDPRFARDVAEQVGYLPKRLLCAPIEGHRGQPVGVLSVVDRGEGSGDPLALVDAIADQATFAVEVLGAGVDLGATVAAGLAEMLVADAPDFAAALRATKTSDRRGTTPRLAALLAELGTLSSAERDLALAIVEQVVAYARSRKRR